MSAILEFIVNWWGLIGFAIIVVLKFVYDRKNMVEKIVELIFLAEEKAKKHVLKTGEEKFQWVIENGYQYLPTALKPFISREFYAVIVQAVFDRIVKWAKDEDLLLG